MRGNLVPNARAIWPENHQEPWLGSPNIPEISPPLSVDAGSALWSGDARLESVVRAGGIQDPASGSLSGGGQRSSRTRSADGGAVGPPSGHAGDAGPCFDQGVVPGGYAWWYVDAISDDGQHGLTFIAFVVSVFSPYDAWADGAIHSITAPSMWRCTVPEPHDGR